DAERSRTPSYAGGDRARAPLPGIPAQHPPCPWTVTATAGTTHAHEGCQRRSTSLSPDASEPIPTPRQRVTWIPRFGTIVPSVDDVQVPGRAPRGAPGTSRTGGSEVEQLGAQPRLGVRDAELGGALVGRRQQAADASRHGVLG